MTLFYHKVYLLLIFEGEGRGRGQQGERRKKKNCATCLYSQSIRTHTHTHNDADVHWLMYTSFARNPLSNLILEVSPTSKSPGPRILHRGADCDIWLPDRLTFGNQKLSIATADHVKSGYSYREMSTFSEGNTKTKRGIGIFLFLCRRHEYRLL